MKFRLIVFLLIFSFSFLAPIKVFAEKINSFDVSVTANKDGTMNIVEDIEYDFETEYRHGIERFIPLYSKVGELYRIIKIRDVKVERDGKKEELKKSQTKDQIYLRIGNPDKTINGSHDYKISYTVENGIGSNFDTHDEIYWNATGNYWSVPIERASIDIKTNFGLKQDRVACFTRSSNFNAQFCQLDSADSTKTITTSMMHPGEGLTVVYGYPVDTFPKSILSKTPPMSIAEKFARFVWNFRIFIWLGLNILLPIILIIWYQKKKNKKRFGEPSVNFEIPSDEKGKKLYPALAGTIDTAQLDRDDIVATIFDFAIRKYIKLEEEKADKKLGIFGKDKKQKIVKLKEKDKDLNKFEEILFDRLFQVGDSVYVETLKIDFYTTFGKLETQVFKDLVERKYYVKNPKTQRALLFILGLFTLFSLNLILGITLIYLSRKLIGRTALGDEVDFKVDGLKLFLKSMNRNYKWQAEKFYTIEHMIPYAMGLGYIDEFMEQVKIIKPDYNPSWYSGTSKGFYSFYPAFTSSVSSNVTTSAPSSSSGFSGGSSGGGGGGGGGGSW